VDLTPVDRHRTGDQEMAVEVLIGSYSGGSREDFYREEQGIIKVDTVHGTMWVPLAITGARKHKFDPQRERVIVIMPDGDVLTYSTTRSDDGKEVVLRTDEGFAFIVQLPPQWIPPHLIKESEDEANMPTKTLTGSNSEGEDRYTFGTDDYKVVARDDMLLLKGKGGQIAIGEEGIITTGKEISMDFFGSTKMGILKENWLGQLLPSTLKVAMEMGTGTPVPNYLPDLSVLTNITKGLLEAVQGASQYLDKAGG